MKFLKSSLGRLDAAPGPNSGLNKRATVSTVSLLIIMFGALDKAQCDCLPNQINSQWRQLQPAIGVTPLRLSVFHLRFNRRVYWNIHLVWPWMMDRLGAAVGGWGGIMASKAFSAGQKILTKEFKKMTKKLSFVVGFSDILQNQRQSLPSAGRDPTTSPVKGLTERD